MARLKSDKIIQFFFVQDYRHKYRYFSSEPVHQIQADFSRLKEIWELAKKKLMLLPQKILVQEQTFEKILKIEQHEIRIHYSGHLGKKRMNIKFYFFLQKQRTKHILLLIGETLLLPISGFMALLPGPNVFFGILALIMITHWQSLRGINKLLKKEYLFIPSKTLKEWEQAVKENNEDDFIRILEKIAKDYDIHNIQKILLK